MTIRKQAGAVILSALAVAMMGGLPLLAQEPAAPKVTTARKKQERVHPIPSYFGQIGLTEQQRASIHEIQARRREKIEALEKQVVEEKAAMLAECDGVLTDVQRKLLENLRAAAAARNAARSANAPKASN